MPVTPKQRQVFDYICRYAEANKMPPTIAEIGRQFKMSSPASVHTILTNLEREGLIRKIPNISRGVEILKQPVASEYEAPLLGRVAAGQPIEAILSNETVAVPRDMTGRGRIFALKVKGDSMIDEQIRDDDLIIVESRQTAENGQTVVALIDGGEATVKKFYNKRDHIRLEPANPKYDPIIVRPPGRLSIQGVVIGVIRKYEK